MMVERQTFTYMWSRIFVGYDAISGLFTFTFKWRSETPEQGAVGWLFLYVFDKSYICVWQISYLYLTNFILVLDKFYICIWPISYLYLTNIIFVLALVLVNVSDWAPGAVGLGRRTLVTSGSIQKVLYCAYMCSCCILRFSYFVVLHCACCVFHVFLCFIVHVAFFMFFSWSNIALYVVRNRQHILLYWKLAHSIPP